MASNHDFFSTKDDNEQNKNKQLFIDKSKQNLLFLPKIQKTPSFVSEKANRPSQQKIKNDNELFELNKYIHNQIRQNENSSHHQNNHRIINESIKKKLFERINSTNENCLRSEKTENLNASKTSKLNSENHITKKSFTSIKNSSNSNLLKFENSDKKEVNKENSDIKKVRIENPQNLKINKKKKKVKLISRSKLLLKYRKISRTKNLYDSNDEDESEEEEHECVIDPETNFITIFDSLIILFFLFYFILTTLSLARERCFCPNPKNFTFSDILLFMNDFLCFFDLIISFFRGYYSYDYSLVKIKRLIVINYLNGDFFLDFLNSIPIFSITKFICFNQINDNNYENCFRYEIPKRYLLLKFGSLLKVTKAIKILGHKKNKALEKLIESVSNNYAIERTLIIFIYSLKYIGIFHFFVCIHIFIGNHTYPNWLNFTKSYDESFLSVYISSLYFVIATLTTVGYGDIVSQSLFERIFQLILLAIGSVVYPYVVSTIGNFIRNDSNAKIQQEHNLNILENIRRDNPNMPFKLYNKIYKYIESKETSLEKYDVNLLVETLPFALKNNILFIMYKSIITNFKFFNKNNNSVFIAEVLNNLVPSVSKKNEFLIYEGEILEEIIFIKNGRISLNAAINMENPLNSIYKYFYESFSPFTSEEERKIINENINTKSYISTMNFDKIKIKLNSAFKNFMNENDKSQFEIHTNFKKSEDLDFHMKGGVIIKEEGNYQYLKILELRKNEHFGCVFMTLNRPCPLSLQVKSKIAELFLLKKEQALNISKNYHNIWRKIYGKEFRNMIRIKKYTFSILKKYIYFNELMCLSELDKLKISNDAVSFDLNYLQKSAFTNKSAKKYISTKKSFSPNKKEMSRNNSLNFESEKKSKKLNLDAFKINIKSNIKKRQFQIRRKSTFDETTINQLSNNILNIMNPKKSNIKTLKFSDQNFDKNNMIKNQSKSNLKNSPQKKINIINYLDNNKRNRKVIKTKKEKLNNLRLFLIECKKIFMEYKNKYTNRSNNDDKNKNHSILRNKTKKSCLKKKSPDMNHNKFNLFEFKPIYRHSNLSVEFDLTSKKEKNIEKYPNNILNDKLINDLKDICEEETDFSFCSTNEDNDDKSNKLCIERNTFFEINSSYDNLNKITKGKYIKDIHFQNKLRMILQNYYKYNKIQKNKDSSDINDTLLLRIAFSTELENTKLNLNNFKDKSKSKYISKCNNKNKENIKNKNNLFSKNLEKADIEIQDSIDPSHDDYYSQNSYLSNEQNNEKIDSGSVVINKSNTSSYSKKPEKEESESISNENSLNVNIKKDVNVFDNEIEYVIEKGKSNNQINYTIYNKKKWKKNKSNYSNQNNKLLNQMLGLQTSNLNLTNNNFIATSSKMKNNKDDFNSVENIKNIENLSIYNIFQKNINKNLNFIDKKEKETQSNFGKSFCCVI